MSSSTGDPAAPTAPLTSQSAVPPADLAQAYDRERAERVRAEAAVFERDQMLSILSHDLRGPLNAIHSWSHVLERKVDLSDPGVQRALGGVRTGVEQQVRLIEEVVDATRQATRHLQIARRPVELSALLPTVVANVRDTVGRARNVSIGEQPMSAPQQAEFDAERVWQAVWVMLDYGVTRTASHGSIAIDSAAGSGNWTVLVEFTAEDNEAAPMRADQLPPALTLPLRVAEAHGGHLTMIRNEGAAFAQQLRLSLPLFAPPQVSKV
ncbi:sensor histidine kinase [Chitinasiproducens palmae]|uniref:histidine kinase n=1 Tax=Chitinasiproducens palmae TaxID=1770053 RepID=A0A1H2PM92_9BURK|nr:histidine kinase dimerization/phospho-acceptor domain-containing protein [Chitinasiproducens palmae]SDV47660.1 Signal transduction histidine kinase [Chitinasiproducens palmae]